jgi:hypothetical protein
VPDWGGNDGDERSRSFAKTDQQVSALKEGIARQREVIKQAKLRGHSTAAAEAARQALEGTLRVFESAAGRCSSGWKQRSDLYSDRIWARRRLCASVTRHGRGALSRCVISAARSRAAAMSS